MRRRPILYAIVLVLAAPVVGALTSNLWLGERAREANRASSATPASPAELVSPAEPASPAERASAQDPLRLRVLSYNILHGEGTDGSFDLERLAEVIADHEPDLVALQEVDRETRRSSGVDQAAELGRLTDMHQVFGQAMPFSGGGYGEGVLSRFPMLEVKNHELPFLEDHEPRVALAVRVRPWPVGPDVLFVGTHLDHTREHTNRLMQARTINEVLRDEGDIPMILAGDLNAIPGSPPMLEFERFWTDAAEAGAAASGSEPEPTFPSDRPVRRIDYVLFRPAERWRVVEVTVVPEEVASDHCPLLVVLEYVPPEEKP